MHTSSISSAVGDDAELAAEVHEYLQMIANMQREAEERRCEIETLRRRAAVARCEEEKWHLERNAAAARLAHTTANGLLLQVEYQTLARQQQEAELTVLMLKKQKIQWDAILPSCSNSSHIEKNSCDSNLDNVSDDNNTGSLMDSACVKIPQTLAWALSLWRQLPQSEEWLQELNAATAELFAQLQEDMKTNASSPTECLLGLLPDLNDTERALLSLLTFPFSNKKDTQS
ncbi:uncharacterized protein TM35_000191300 [Trypanosoma theileri]|uniref:Uncharacterized protein n=1 Tax=Trypanosoma theileri TaxID=67003 RepID=A0A1X0NT46_9TRYP|nr:uncharacterized protein TM35_000191300 [Trypanosoma theileri]ORC87886.1 hypothetical protein TM35_000191300 [Trypanosoma theileri]